jgi:heat shock protein HslJ
MKKLLWTAIVAAGLLGARAAGACDEVHQTAQQEQKTEKKVAKKSVKKAAPTKNAATKSEKSS